MKVVLLKDVPGFGKKYDEKTVSPGYGRNFLIARGFATQSSASILKEIRKKKDEEQTEREIQERLLIKNIEGLEGIRIVIKEKSNEQGHLFAGIHKDRIAQAIKEQSHLDIDPDFIDLKEHIKETGEHKVQISAHGKKAECVVSVEAQ